MSMWIGKEVQELLRKGEVMNVRDVTTCKHTKYVAAGYPIKGGPIRGDIRMHSLYHVFCLQCRHYVNLLDGSCIDDLGLVHQGAILGTYAK